MNEIKSYSKAIVYLLRKTVEKSSPVWNDILLYQSNIQEYLSVIGLELIVKKDEGFCQGIFIPFGITVDDEVEIERNGGLGSTTK